MITPYLTILGIFLFISLVYWIIYDEYLKKVLLHKKIPYNIKLPDRRIILYITGVLSLIILVIIGQILIHQYKETVDENMKYEFTQYVTLGDMQKVEHFINLEHPDFNINQTDALYISIRTKDILMTHYLLESGADPNQMVDIPLDSRCSLLTYTVIQNNHEVVELLVDYDANPKYKLYNYHENNPFYEAIKNDNLDILKLLISHTDNFTGDAYYHEYLELARDNGNQEMIQYLESFESK